MIASDSDLPAPEADGLFAQPVEPPPVLTTVERAFELANCGDFVTIDQIADQLRSERREGVDAALFDADTRRSLRQACVQSRRPYKPA